MFGLAVSALIAIEDKQNKYKRKKIQQEKKEVTSFIDCLDEQIDIKIAGTVLFTKSALSAQLFFEAFNLWNWL